MSELQVDFFDSHVNLPRATLINHTSSGTNGDRSFDQRELLTDRQTG
jgi:hypothetical protein